MLTFLITNLFIKEPVFTFFLDQFSFDQVWKSNWFALLCNMIGLKYLASLFHAIRSKTRTNIVTSSCMHLFLQCALHHLATCNLLQVWIGSLDCLCSLQLARMLTLVMVLWHSIWNPYIKYNTLVYNLHVSYSCLFINTYPVGFPCE